MDLKAKVSSDLKKAIKGGNIIERETLRMLEAAIKNREIEKKKKEEGLSGKEVAEVVAREMKSRRDSVQQYTEGGRPDLADKESKEIAILERYMPEQLSESEVLEAVEKAIAATGAMSKKDFGKVMGFAMEELRGKADGSAVKKIVEEKLAEQ